MINFHANLVKINTQTSEGAFAVQNSIFCQLTFCRDCRSGLILDFRGKNERNDIL